MAASKGMWFDTKAGKVVESEPEQGIVLLAPGVVATPDDERRLAAYKPAEAKADKTVTTSKTGK